MPLALALMWLKGVAGIAITLTTHSQGLIVAEHSRRAQGVQWRCTLAQTAPVVGRRDEWRGV